MSIHSSANTSDDPQLPARHFVCWTWNGFRWPDERRQLAYLSRSGYPLNNSAAALTEDWAEAETFTTLAAARYFVRRNEGLQRYPYRDLLVTTVAALRQTVGFPRTV